VPDTLDPSRPLELVIFFHGWSGCAASLVSPGRVPCVRGARAREGWDLAGVHDSAARNSVLVVPQLAWLARDGSPGRFRDPEAFARFLAAALAEANGPTLDAFAAITLVAHSAGYETLLAVLPSDPRIRHVVLLDALYAGSDAIASWVAGDTGRRAVSLYTGERSTYEQSHALARRAREALGDAAVAVEPAHLAHAIAERRVVIARARSPHGAIPQRELGDLLRALPGVPNSLATPATLR
jgi:hypothetical protein